MPVEAMLGHVAQAYRLVTIVTLVVWLVLSVFLLTVVILVWRLPGRQPNRGAERDDSLYPNVGEPFHRE